MTASEDWRGTGGARAEPAAPQAFSEPQCRRKRMELGLPYPKSSCSKCGPVIRPGWKCAEEEEEEAHGAGPPPEGPIVDELFRADYRRVAEALLSAAEARADPRVPMWKRAMLRGTAAGFAQAAATQDGAALVADALHDLASAFRETGNRAVLADAMHDLATAIREAHQGR